MRERDRKKIPAMRSALSAALLLGLEVSSAVAQTGFYLPTPTPSPGQDEFRASDGTSCRTTMDGSKRVEVGTFATGGQPQDNIYSIPQYVSRPNPNNLGVYARYSWSLDAPSTRMDCNKLYQLEVEKKELEIKLLKRSLAAAEEKLDVAKTMPAMKLRGSGNMPPP